MQSESVITDTERERLAQTEEMKAADSHSQSAAMIERLTKELMATREELEGAIATQMVISKELDKAREQIAELERAVKFGTEAANRAAEARLKLLIELENLENEKARIEADAPGDYAALC
jgi:chromosome segregation ATPase